MSELVDIYKAHLSMESQYEKLNDEFNEKTKMYFFDVQIDCCTIILPAHKHVLASRSVVLAEKLSSGVNDLDWTDYNVNVSTALLRWIYTNQIVLDDDNIVLGLLRASYHFQLPSLFQTCERALLWLVSEKTSLQFNDIAKKVGANRLMAKCLELRSNFSDHSPINWVKRLDEEEDSDLLELASQDEYKSEINKQITDQFQKVKTLHKIMSGFQKFATFSDAKISTMSGSWPAHAFFLSTRSNIVHDELLRSKNNKIYFTELYGYVEYTFLRWLYTDVIVFDDENAALNLLTVSHVYQLPTLFERCEEALLHTATVSSCATLHRVASKVGSMALLNRCKQWIAAYWYTLQSPDCFKMDVDSKMETDSSSCEMVEYEFPSERTEGLLMLNDDCLLHIFRFISLVDLGSIKDTCQRLSRLADQSFKLRKDKSLTISISSMFADIWTLKHFGKSIDSLQLDSFYKQYASCEMLFEMIAKYANEKMQSISLNLDCEPIASDESFKCLAKILKNVKSIQLNWFLNDHQIDLVIGYCENLTEVHISGEEMTREAHWFPKNVNITSLTLSGLCNDNILDDVCEKLTNLEYLSFDCVSTTSNKVFNLRRLTHLRKLKIGGYDNIGDVLQKFDNKNVLQYLCLSYSHMRKSLAKALGQFPNLKELVFENFYTSDEDNLSILSKKLNNVEKLAFIDCEEITFEDITKMVENLLNLKELTIHDCTNIDVMDKKSYLRLIKKRNLDIFLEFEEYNRTMKSIGNDLSKYVRVKPLE